MFRKSILFTLISAFSLIKASVNTTGALKEALIAGKDVALVVGLYNMLSADEQTKIKPLIDNNWQKKFPGADPIETLAKSVLDFQARIAANSREAFVTLITSPDQPGYKVIKGLNPSANVQGVIKTALGD